MPQTEDRLLTIVARSFGLYIGLLGAALVATGYAQNRINRIVLSGLLFITVATVVMVETISMTSVLPVLRGRVSTGRLLVIRIAKRRWQIVLMTWILLGGVAIRVAYGIDSRLGLALLALLPVSTNYLYTLFLNTPSAEITKTEESWRIHPITISQQDMQDFDGMEVFFSPDGMDLPEYDEIPPFEWLPRTRVARGLTVPESFLNTVETRRLDYQGQQIVRPAAVYSFKIANRGKATLDSAKVEVRLRSEQSVTSCYAKWNKPGSPDAYDLLPSEEALVTPLKVLLTTGFFPSTNLVDWRGDITENIMDIGYTPSIRFTSLPSGYIHLFPNVFEYDISPVPIIPEQSQAGQDGSSYIGEWSGREFSLAEDAVIELEARVIGDDYASSWIAIGSVTPVSDALKIAASENNWGRRWNLWIESIRDDIVSILRSTDSQR